MNKSDELRMTYSGLMMKDGEKMVHVYFERNQGDYAEGIVPRGVIVKYSGFSDEEIQQLVIYLQDNASEIIKQAKQIRFLDKWIKDK